MIGFKSWVEVIVSFIRSIFLFIFCPFDAVGSDAWELNFPFGQNITPTHPVFRVFIHFLCRECRRDVCLID